MDGGWGWAVVLASFLISLIADGISFSFGLLYVELLDYFGASKAATAWVGSLFMAVPLLSGPLCSALVDRFGCRSMTIVGGVVSCLGLALSSLASSLGELYFTFGLVAGLGLGLCYVTAVVSVAGWFTARRGLAVALGASGTGIGTFLYAPLTANLLLHYGWRGTSLLLGGTLLNMSVCGALMRPPPPPPSSAPPPPPAPPLPPPPSLDFQSVLNLPTFLREDEKVPEEVLESLTANNRRVYRVMLENYPSLLGCDSPPEPSRPPRPHRCSIMYRGAMLNMHKYRVKALSCPDISSIGPANRASPSWKEEVRELVREMTDFSMFLELHFLLVSVATGIVFVWFIVPYFYLAELMAHYDYTEHDASIVISVIGVTNTVGMVGFGWAADRPWLNVAKVYSVCLMLTGVFTAALPLATPHFPSLIATSAGFGAFFASCYSFTPPLLVELVPLDRFTTAYGLSLLCQGVGNLLGPPLAGWVYDMTERWDYSFYLAGIWLVIAGILIALLPATPNIHLNRRNTTTLDATASP